MNALTEAKSKKEIFDALETVHLFASGALERIAGIARCALHSLESVSGAADLEAVAQALKAIAMDAQGTDNDISMEAERCGVQTIDEQRERRFTAMCKAMGKKAGAQ